MALTPFRFLSVQTVCRQVGTIAEAMATPNAIFRGPVEPPIDFTPPDFFDPADADDAARLASRERNRERFGVGFDSSKDLFFARLDDVVIHRRSVRGQDCFRLFLDRGVALTEPYAARYKADWPLMRRYDAIEVDVDGARVPVYLYDAIEPEVVLDDPALLMLDPGAQNYYHWMCEVLPRLWAREAEPSLGKVPMLVGETGLTAFQHQTLSTLSPALLTPFPWQCARIKRLYVGSFLASGEVARRLRPWFAALRTRLGGDTPRDTPRRLYLSREDAARRRVTNDREVADALRRLGFASVTLDGMSVVDQLDLFAGAEAVVLPHGAAGANLAAASAGALVVECHPASLLNPTYWALSRALDHRYGMVTSGSFVDGEPDYAADMTIDVPKLLRVVDAGLSSR